MHDGVTKLKKSVADFANFKELLIQKSDKSILYTI